MDDYRRIVIQCVKDRPLLWDPRDADYKNNEERKRAWEDIDENVKPPSGVESNAKDMWFHLSRGFSNALRRREKRASGSSHATGADMEVEWRFERNMQFLLPAKQIRGGSCFAPMKIEVDPDYDPIKECHSSEDGSSSYNERRDETRHKMFDYLHEYEDDDVVVDDDGYDNENDNVKSDRKESFNVAQPSSSSQNSTFYTSVSRSRKRKRGYGDENHDNDANRINSPVNSNTSTSHEHLQAPGHMMVREWPRLGFFLSMMPMVNSLNEDQFMDFQMDVLQAMKRQRQEAGRAGIETKQVP